MTNNDTQQALQRVIERSKNEVCNNSDYENYKQNEADCLLLRQALQSQAEKDRVLKLMENALRYVRHRDARWLDDETVSNALSEYHNLQGRTKDE